MLTSDKSQVEIPGRPICSFSRYHHGDFRSCRGGLALGSFWSVLQQQPQCFEDELLQKSESLR